MWQVRSFEARRKRLNMEMMNILIRENGDVEEFLPKGEKFTLDELYEAVDGDMIQCLYGKGCIFVCYEEAWLKQKKNNPKATEMLWEMIPAHRGFNYFVGPVALIETKLFD